ncbi:thiamine phosphate synthase [Aciduricibacillus chroicocephali]|uniref:Thiamine-phosphate synthase n=1 Tax=Aciduricibacillus chroicocephali TaxID=3054939 RepID=A0ABY9KXX8_9BACI|nr:thiamine phosphate synthase [Bacillaceae bacterium 44XB]
MIFDRKQLRKYFVMGSQNCVRAPGMLLEEAARSGITAFQFREKGPGSVFGGDKIRLGKRFRDICKRYNIPFIINDDIELIDFLEADGIHLGQQDAKADEIRAKYPDLIIGLSVSNMEEAKSPQIEYADYLGAGPVFWTATKVDAKQATGVEWIEQLRVLYPDKPIVGIGGIKPENAQSVLEAGADGVAIISAITRSKNVQETIDQL